MMLQNRIIAVGIIILLGCACYANSISGKFIWDDELLITNNPHIKSWSNMTRLFTEDIGEGTDREYALYHPARMLTYMLNYSLNGLDPRGYHIFNMVIHIFTALALYWLIAILFGDRLLSFLTAAFFVVHPLNVEAVTYISGRADCMVAMFMLLCLVFYAKAVEQKKPLFYIFTLLLYVAALFSKENAFAFPIVMLLYHYAFRKKINWKIFACVWGTFFGYIALRLTVLKSGAFHAFSVSRIFEKLPGLFTAIVNYIKLFFLPFNLHLDYGNPLFNFADLKAILGVVVSLALVIYALKKRKTDSMVCFSILWFFVTLAPVSNLYPLPFYMADHYMYIPYMGFFLILARFLRNHRYILFALIAFYSVLTIKQNNYWQEPVAFYERTVKYAIPNARLYNQLGKAYNEAGEHDAALSTYERGLAIDPHYARLYYNLGNAYKSVDKYVEAADAYEKAVSIRSDYALAYNNLGLSYHTLGRYEEALEVFEKVIEVDPDDAFARNNIGLAYSGLARYEEAIKAFEKSLELDPGNSAVRNNLEIIRGRAKTNGR